ncbi:MAG: type IV toxin-antitoxin system AbiEi family antitoxin domain-containing protein [Candidatus Omnitrophota bacterium]|jgi:biotin operon repressor
MNYLKIKKIGKPYFGYEDISRALGISRESARVAATRLVKSGVLVRAKRNIYVLSERWDSLSIEESFILANLLQVPSYISLMTALSYYEVTTQLQRDFVESVGHYRTKLVEINKRIFNYSKINKKLYFGFLKNRGFFIASPEKAFLDACYLTSLKKYNFDLTSINPGKLNFVKVRAMAKVYPAPVRKLLVKYGYIKKA